MEIPTYPDEEIEKHDAAYWKQRYELLSISRDRIREAVREWRQAQWGDEQSDKALDAILRQEL